MGKIIIHHDDMQIKIKGGSDVSHQDLYTKAIVSLIYEADVHGWEKFSQADTNPLYDFCAAVLDTVTRLWTDEAELPDEQAEVPSLGTINLPLSKSVHELLVDMIRQLRQDGYLQDHIAGPSRLRPDEPKDFN
jgi:hypothetical protein